MTKTIDYFISHAHEDAAVAATLAERLGSLGFSVWLDAGQLTAGDRLLKEINSGLTKCRFGIVLLSKHFFDKDWPQWELERLAAIETAERRKVILPVVHEMSIAEVAAIAPVLAGRLALNTAHGLEKVLEGLRAAARAGGGPAASPNRGLEAPVLSASEDTLEPVDLYADAEEEFERGREASERISDSMREFTLRMNAFTAGNRELVERRERLSQRALRSRINELVPMFDAHSLVLQDNSTSFGVAMGRGLLRMTQGLVVDPGDTTAQRARWRQILEEIDTAAKGSLDVTRRSRDVTVELRGYTVALKHAKRRLVATIEEFIAAHDLTLEDIRQARTLLGDGLVGR